MGGGVDMNGPGLGSLMLSGFSVLPEEPETVTLPATMEPVMKVVPQLWPRKQPSLWVFFFKKKKTK